MAESKRLLATASAEHARLKRTSRTSSEPPSSDIVKPPAEKGGSGSRPGGRKRKPG